MPIHLLMLGSSADGFWSACYVLLAGATSARVVLASCSRARRARPTPRAQPPSRSVGPAPSAATLSSQNLAKTHHICSRAPQLAAMRASLRRRPDVSRGVCAGWTAWSLMCKYWRSLRALHRARTSPGWASKHAAGSLQLSALVPLEGCLARKPQLRLPTQFHCYSPIFAPFTFARCLARWRLTASAPSWCPR